MPVQTQNAKLKFNIKSVLKKVPAFGANTYHPTQPSLLAEATFIVYIFGFTEKHRKNCECCPVSQLIVR